MDFKKKQKLFSSILIATLLFGTTSQAVAPIIAHGATEDVPEVVREHEDTLSVSETLTLDAESESITVEGIVAELLEDTLTENEGVVTLALSDKAESTNYLYVVLSLEDLETLGVESVSELVGERVVVEADLDVSLEDNRLTNVSSFTILDDQTIDLEVEDEVDSVEEEVGEELEETDLDDEDDLEEEDTDLVDDEETDEVIEEESLIDEALTNVDDSEQVESFSTFQALDDEDDQVEFELSLMHMNDTHARVDAFPKMLTAVNDFRADNPDALLFHAGDVFSGTLYFNQFLGQADLALMNMMNFDAMVFGNHEFDLGDSEGGHKSLAQFIEGANFDILGTNVDFTNDPFVDDSLVEDTLILDVDGERIGVFGLVTEDTRTIASPAQVVFQDAVEAAERVVAEFEEVGVDKIIALTHLGFDSATDYVNDLRLADAVPEIDIIVGGHSHTALAEPRLVNAEDNPTLIVQAGENAEHLGTLNVTFDGNGIIINHSGELVEVDGLEANQDALNILEPFEESVEEFSNQETGATALYPLINPRLSVNSLISVRSNETALGNLITDAMLAKAQEKFPTTVIAFQNGGGIRNSIDAGPITTGEIISVLPFANDPVIADLTGHEIKELLELSVRHAPEENGGFLHVSGMRFTFDRNLDLGSKVLSMEVASEDGWVEINFDQTYRVTTNGFTGRGGDGLDTFAKANEEGRVRDIGEIDWEQLRDYMVEEEYLGGVVSPELEGRVTDVGASFSLSVMHMNDTHAHVDNYPHMLSAVNEYRNVYDDDSLLFHAGDVFSGTLYFNEFQGEADLALLNLMDIDAMVFGNHEFDLGLSEDGHGALARFVSEANFPFLGTNIDFSNDPNMSPLVNSESNPDGPIFDQLVFEVDGEQIGVFGLLTEDTQNIASPGDVEFDSFIEAARDAVEAFKNDNINKIIALTHLGFDSAPFYGNDLRLASEVDGIDIIVGGHSHTALEEPVVVESEGTAPTIIVQAGSNADYLGTLTVEFNDEGEIIKHAGELLDVSTYDADETGLKALEEYSEAIEELRNTPTGAVAMKDLLNPRHGDGDEVSVRADETELGNLITDAMLAKAQEKFPEAVIAFQNGGGIRAPIMAGDITVGQVIEVLPFGNDPVIVELTGQEIKELLEFSVRQAPEENGGFLHVSGMRFYYDSTAEENERVVYMEVNRNGEWEEITNDGLYLVTTNGFTGRGGDGYELFEEINADGRVRDIGEIDWEQLMDYMVEEEYLGGVVDPVLEGRIVDLLGEELPTDPSDPTDPDDPSQEVIIEEGVQTPIEPGQTITVPDRQVTIELPSDLPVGTEITIDILSEDDLPELESEGMTLQIAGEVVRVTIHYPEGYEDYEGDFILTLRIFDEFSDQEVAIYYYDEEAETWIKVGGARDGNSISVTVTHFSIYGVFAEVSDEDDEGGPVDTDEPSEPGDTDDATSPDQSEKPSGDGETLPSTATQTYLYLVSGAGLLLIGASLLLINKKKLAKD